MSGHMPTFPAQVVNGSTKYRIDEVTHSIPRQLHQFRQQLSGALIAPSAGGVFWRSYFPNSGR